MIIWNVHVISEIEIVQLCIITYLITEIGNVMQRRAESILSALSTFFSVLFSLQYTVYAFFTITIILSCVYSMVTIFCLVYILCIHLAMFVLCAKSFIS